MMSSTFPLALALLLFPFMHLIVARDTLNARADCSKSYTICQPKGASTQDEPPVGSALSPLFVDIVNTVDSNHNHKREAREDHAIGPRVSTGSLCCADGTQCLLLQDYNLPFCYDNFTTNYFLPGGSYGQIVSGNYTSSDGPTANLISGNYTLSNGTSGNIYGSPSSPAKPDTAALAIPTQYTASGSSSAIPVTELGQEITYTTTIPGTTIPPSILPTVTTMPTVSAGSTVSFVTTEPVSTIPGTTVAPQTSTVTTRLAGASATKKGAASSLQCGPAILYTAALFELILLIMLA